MKINTSSLVCLATLVLSHLGDAKKVTDPKKPPKNAVLLSTVNSLTLRAGKQTSARRSSAVPQLTCSGPAHVCKLYSVDVMRCTNEGSDYDKENVQWSCKASLPPEFKLGATEMGCEGYESSEDPYVLKGSCGVEYRLLLTDLGEEKYGITNEKSIMGDFAGGKDMGSQLFGFLFILLFIGVVFLILRSIYRSVNDPNRPIGAAGTGWGGGGGGGGNDDPPPPYDDYSAPPRKPSTRGPRSSSSRTGQGSQAGGDQWRPGFWTGTAAGAAGAYAAGRYANRNRAPPPETRQTGGGWFGVGPSNTNTNYGGGRSPSSGFGSSGPSYSSSRQESTGFGGTSRR
jgi:hypothetical protein